MPWDKNLKKILISLYLFFLFISKSYAEITYLEVLKNPTDLRLNLQYAKEQEQKGEFKSVIGTLERLITLYPNNIDLKLYLLSISIKVDSTEKTLNLIQEIQNSNEISADIKNQITKIFEDMNKRKVDKALVKKKEREKTKLTAQKLQKQKSQEEKRWTWYTEVSSSHMLNSNISNVSDSKTKFSGGTIVSMSGVEGDDVSTLRNTYGAIYQINKTSNLSFSLGHTTSEQNRDTSDENDTQSFSATYSKFLKKNSITATYTGNETKVRNAADSITQNISIDNRFVLTDKQKILTGINYGQTNGNQNSSNASKRSSNTWKQGAVIGYEYFFTPQHNIKIKHAFTDTHAIQNSNAYDNHTLTASYGKNFKLGNLGLTYSTSFKDYDEPDVAFIHPKGRRDKTQTKTISFNGNLNQIFSNQDILPISDKFDKFLNTLNFNTSWSETQSEGTLLQHDYKKQSFTFGLTKRIYF